MPATDCADHFLATEALYSRAAIVLGTGLATGNWECVILCQAGSLHPPQPSWSWHGPTPTPPADVARQITADVEWLRSEVLPKLRDHAFHGTATILLNRDTRRGLTLSANVRQTLRRPLRQPSSSADRSNAQSGS